MKMRPMIAVSPLYDRERKSYWMLPGYMRGVELAGGIPIMLPLTSDRETIQMLVQQFDGFLFTGGQDVSPQIYGEASSERCGEICEMRDTMERILLDCAIFLDKPVFGICRGIQFLNAVFGGTLYQDLPTEHPSAVEHHQKPPYDIPVHTVEIERGTPLHRLLHKERLEVNSYHHQAIKRLAPPLRVMAWAQDGVIEAVYMPDAAFLWAVQWHPEFSYGRDEDSLSLLKEFVRCAAHRSEERK